MVVQGFPSFPLSLLSENYRHRKHECYTDRQAGRKEERKKKENRKEERKGRREKQAKVNILIRHSSAAFL